MFKLAWATDVHLNFLRLPGAARSFAEYLASETSCDALLLTGDITELPHLRYTLEELAAGLQRPLYFVLGNHDYYQGSFAEGREIASSFEGWLDKEQAVFELSPTIALVGSEGWYDAERGLPFAESFTMADWVTITDIKEVSAGIIPRYMKSASLEARKRVVKLSRERSRAAADAARSRLVAALEKYTTVIFATHFPPFQEACWHEGNLSEPPWLPWFTSVYMGDMLTEVADQHPDRKILVLCGHTHSSGTYLARPNLKVLTGEAVYGAPDLAGTLEVSDGLYVTMKLNKAWYTLAPF